ncbi:rhomboid-like protein [Streptomyces celluloflavus]|uniref:rhomboid-like protein n=1 Tax=Streptomyces celluloflavus TaxID=58344 RepID=UPI0036DD3489
MGTTDTAPDGGVRPAGLAGIPRQRGATAAAPVGGGGPAADPPTGHPRRRWRPWLLLPTPLGTPFTFGYAALLVVTTLFADHADPAVVSELLRGSSTDVVHLARAPLLVLVASALWIAGGLTSAYALGFVFVLTALERRVGGLRTAAVFFGGHALATVATELTVGFSVAAGGLPDSSLERLDYGISFGVMTCTGALAGLLPPWLRRPLVLGAGYVAVADLLAYADPVANWGHLLSLTLGVVSWPLLRRWRDRRTAVVPLLGDLGHPALRGSGPR